MTVQTFKLDFLENMKSADGTFLQATVELFENGKRYTKSETTTQKALEERIPNHILHVQF